MLPGSFEMLHSTIIRREGAHFFNPPVSWVTELGGGDFLYLSIPMILLLRKECQWVQLSRCLLMRTTIGSQDMSFSRNSNWSNARFLTVKRSRPFGPFRF